MRKKYGMGEEDGGWPADMYEWDTSSLVLVVLPARLRCVVGWPMDVATPGPSASRAAVWTIAGALGTSPSLAFLAGDPSHGPTTLDCPRLSSYVPWRGPDGP